MFKFSAAAAILVTDQVVLLLQCSGLTTEASPTLCIHPVIPDEHYILLYDVDIYPPGQGHGHSCYV